MSVLIITERNDIHGDALIWALGLMGVRCDRWSISDSPERQKSSIRISNLSPEPVCRISGLDSSMSYTSIWLRRLAAPQAISERLAAADTQMATFEARRFTDGMRTVLSSGAVWINPLTTKLRRYKT